MKPLKFPTIRFDENAQLFLMFMIPIVLLVFIVWLTGKYNRYKERKRYEKGG